MTVTSTAATQASSMRLRLWRVAARACVSHHIWSSPLSHQHSEPERAIRAPSLPGHHVYLLRFPELLAHRLLLLRDHRRRSLTTPLPPLSLRIWSPRSAVVSRTFAAGCTRWVGVPSPPKHRLPCAAQPELRDSVSCPRVRLGHIFENAYSVLHLWRSPITSVLVVLCIFWFVCIWSCCVENACCDSLTVLVFPSGTNTSSKAIGAQTLQA